MLTGITLTLERLNRYNDHVHHLSGARYMLTFVCLALNKVQLKLSDAKLKTAQTCRHFWLQNISVKSTISQNTFFYRPKRLTVTLHLANIKSLRWYVSGDFLCRRYCSSTLWLVLYVNPVKDLKSAAHQSPLRFLPPAMNQPESTRTINQLHHD